MSREHRQLTVVADADALAKAPADRPLKRINQASGRLAVCLTGGSTPERLYALLATEPYCSAVPWNRVHWFWETTASCRRTIRAAMTGWRAACCSIGSRHHPATSGADLPAARAYAEGDVVWLVDREAAPEHRYVA